MSGILPRSTQHGKKVRLPRNYSFPIVDVKRGASGHVNQPGNLSPYLGQTVILEEDDTKLTRVTDQDDSTFSSLSDIESWDTTGSTSSASWFDEFDAGSTEKLCKELKDIDRVLFEEADIGILRPELRDECQEWKDAFPHLRVTGKSVRNSPVQFKKQPMSIQKYNNYIQDLKSFCVLNKPQSSKGGNLFSESFLKISPIPYDGSRIQQSPTSSIIRSEINSSKWRRPVSPEYSSLPCIPSQQHIRYSSRASGHQNSQRSNNNYDYRKNLEPLQHRNRVVRSGMADSATYQRLSLRSKPLILPPIEQLQIDTNGSNYRSISASQPHHTNLFQHHNHLQNHRNNALTITPVPVEYGRLFSRKNESAK